MSGRSVSVIRVFGLSLLYAVAGVFVLIAALGTADPGLSPDSKSPTGWGAKIVAMLSGVGFLAFGLGIYLAGEPTANPVAATQLELGGAGLGGALLVLSWILIARDLRKRRP